MTTDFYADRVSPVGSLTADEREQARQAFAAHPAILKTLILAALGAAEYDENQAAEMLERIRKGQP